MTDLTKWVKIKHKRKNSGLLLRFLISFPDGIMTPSGPAGPFKAGDLVNMEVVGKEVARVLIENNAVEVYHLEPREW